MSDTVQCKDCSINDLGRVLAQMIRDGFKGRILLVVSRPHHRCPVDDCVYYSDRPSRCKEHLLGKDRHNTQPSECGESLADDLIVTVRKATSNACAEAKDVKAAIVKHGINRAYIINAPGETHALLKISIQAVPRQSTAAQTTQAVPPAQTRTTLAQRTIAKRNTRPEAPARAPRVRATPGPRFGQRRFVSSVARKPEENEEEEVKPVHTVDDDDTNPGSLSEFYSTKVNGVPRAVGIPQSTYDQLETCWINPVSIAQCTSQQYQSLLMDTPQLAGIPVGQRFILWTGVEATYFRQQ